MTHSSKRNYRREYDLYYGEKGKGNPRTKIQALHRKHKTARNKARGSMVRTIGKQRMKGKDVHHKNGNPLISNPSNLTLQSIHVNRGDNKQ